MLEDKGALQGMAASKAFGRDKKWSTFLICLVVGIVFTAILILDLVLSPFSPGLAQLVYDLLSMPVYAWLLVFVSYTYLTYGPSSVPAAPEVSGYGAAPQTTTQQQQATTSMLAQSTAWPAGAPAAASASNRRFCPSCGSPVEASSGSAVAAGRPYERSPRLHYAAKELHNYTLAFGDMRQKRRLSPEEISISAVLLLLFGISWIAYAYIQPLGHVQVTCGVPPAPPNLPACTYITPGAVLFYAMGGTSMALGASLLAIRGLMSLDDQET